MKCPNCGSEKIQFGTNTRGTGFSGGDACCGFILLGPIGLLCGSCGSDVKTDEFWICQNCGSKFSNEEAKRARQQEENERIRKEQEFKNYEKNKQIKRDAIKEYGSITAIKEKARVHDEIADKKIDEFNKSVDDYIKENIGNAEISRLCKIIGATYSKIEIVISIILTLIAIFLLICSVIFIGILLLIVVLGIVLFKPIRTIFAEKKLAKLVLERSLHCKGLYSEAKEAVREYVKWNELVSKIDSCDEYEKANGI